MRTLTIVHSGFFAIVVLGVAGVAGSRVLPYDAPTETHYHARFAARTLGTDVGAAIEYVLFREGHAGVVVGNDGWLYSGEEFRAEPAAEETLATHLALIPWVRDELARQNTQLVVALVPSKARVYPEFTGRHAPAAMHDGLYRRAQGALRDAGIAAPDLAQALTACKSRAPTFMRTDTHGSPAGARCAASALQGPAGGALPGAAPDGEVVVVGTSYSADAHWNLAGALQQSLQRDVANYAARGPGPFLPMLEYLLDTAQRETPAPRLVIWEIPERSLLRAQDLRVSRGGGACALPAGRMT